MMILRLLINLRYNGSSFSNLLDKISDVDFEIINTKGLVTTQTTNNTQ